MRTCNVRRHVPIKVETAEVVCISLDKLFLIAGSPKFIKDAIIKAVKDKNDDMVAKASSALGDLHDSIAADTAVMSKIADVEASHCLTSSRSVSHCSHR